MQTTPSVLDYITLAIAIWGALLSTILAIRSIQKDKRKVRVTCYFKEQTISQDGTPYNMIVGIRAVNTGHRAVRLESAGLLTSSGKCYVLDTRSLPVTLEDGDTVTIGINLDRAEERLRKITPSGLYVSAFVRDTEGGVYKTSRFPEVMVDRNLAKRSGWLRRRLSRR